MTHCCLMASGSLSFGTALGWCDPFMKSCPIVRIDSLRLTTRCRWVSFRWMPGGEWMIHDKITNNVYDTCHAWLNHKVPGSIPRHSGNRWGASIHWRPCPYSSGCILAVNRELCPTSQVLLASETHWSSFPYFFFLFKEKRQLKGTRKKNPKHTIQQNGAAPENCVKLKI